MRVVTLPDAQRELDDALAHYAAIRQQVLDGLFQEVAFAHHKRRPGYWRERLERS